jgi:hypothetical protein
MQGEKMSDEIATEFAHYVSELEGAENTPAASAHLEFIAKRITTILRSPILATYISNDLLVRLKSIHDACAGDWLTENDGDNPDAMYGNPKAGEQYWSQYKFDCSQIRTLAQQELNRRK